VIKRTGGDGASDDGGGAGYSSSSTPTESGDESDTSEQPNTELH
jgi:hypothetical protein